MLFIIWRGLGFLVPLITLLSLALAEKTVDTMFHEAHYYQAHQWPKLLGFWIAAVCVWLLDRDANRRTLQTYIDPKTGAPMQFIPTNSFMGIRLNLWVYILWGIGTICLFYKL